MKTLPEINLVKTDPTTEVKHENYFAKIDNAVNLYRKQIQKEEEELKSYIEYKNLRKLCLL